MDRKTTIIIGVVSCVCTILSIAVGLLLYFYVFNKPETSQTQSPSKTQSTSQQSSSNKQSSSQVYYSHADKYPSSCEAAKDSPYFKNLINKGASKWTDDERNTVIYNLFYLWGIQTNQGDNNNTLLTKLNACKA